MVSVFLVPGFAKTAADSTRGLYLLAHGLIKIFLVAGLLRERLWSFPVATVVLLGFIGYQSARLAVHYSTGVLFLTVLDAVIVALIWREYRTVKRRQEG